MPEFECETCEKRVETDEFPDAEEFKGLCKNCSDIKTFERVT